MRNWPIPYQKRIIAVIWSYESHTANLSFDTQPYLSCMFNRRAQTRSCRLPLVQTVMRHIPSNPMTACWYSQPCGHRQMPKARIVEWPFATKTWQDPSPELQGQPCDILEPLTRLPKRTAKNKWHSWISWCSKLFYTNCNDVIQWVEWFQCGWCECFVPKTPISSQCRSTCLCSHPTCRNWRQWDSQVAPGWNSLTLDAQQRLWFWRSVRVGLLASLVSLVVTRWPQSNQRQSFSVQGLHRRKCRSPVCPWANSLSIKSIRLSAC